MRGDVHDEMLASHIVSVTEVRMSPDLRHATVFVKPLLGADEEAVLKALRQQHRLSAERGRPAGEHQICRQAQIPARRELRRGQPYRRAAARAQGGAGPWTSERSKRERSTRPMAGGRLSRLEPLAPSEHRAALKAACAEDREIWPIYAISYDPDHFDESFDRLLAQPGRPAPSRIFDGGELAGMSAYLGIEPDARRARDRQHLLSSRHCAAPASTGGSRI